MTRKQLDMLGHATILKEKKKFLTLAFLGYLVVSSVF